MPERIQRRRTKGWRLPEGAVVVDRTSRWGNPFKVGSRYISRTAFHDAPYPVASSRELGTFEHAAWSPWPAWTQVVADVRDRAHAVELFRAHVAYEDEDWNPEQIRRDLGGRDLACFCPLGEPCHAAVLLEIANDPEDLPSGRPSD
jgi:hypothetical protein